MTNNRNRDWDQEFRIIEAHANGTGSQKVSKEEVTEENKGFDNPPPYPGK
jgi:hypothetical protein